MEIDKKYDTDKISVLEGFDSMRRFLKTYWKIGNYQSEDLAMLLSSLERDINSKDLPIDQALWHDWVDSLPDKKRL